MDSPSASRSGRRTPSLGRTAHRVRAAAVACACIVGIVSAALLGQQTLPDLVTNFLIAPGDRTITARWQPPRTGPPPTGYRVYWAPYSGRSSAQLDTSVTHYTIDGLTNGTKYTVLVAATDGRGNHRGYRRATATPAKIVAIDGYDVYVTFWTDPTEMGTAALIHGSASTALGNRGAAYHFFGEDNPEVFVKVLDGCAINGHEWVYLAALTTLKYNVRLVRHSDGASRDYRGAMNVGPFTHSDAAAFACVDEPDEPDLIVSSVTVSDGAPVVGQNFKLHATVLNRGDGPASQTTLRYYSSTNSTISMSDSFIASDTVAALSASATESRTIRLAFSAPGVSYVGACIDSVSGESNTRNNCSTGVRMIISPSLSGTWTGSTTTALTPEVGSATATLVQTGSSLSGTWSVSYPSLGANSGTLTGAITGSAVSVTLYPADPSDCQQSVTAILEGSSLNGTWSTINCTVTDGGLLRLTKTD